VSERAAINSVADLTPDQRRVLTRIVRTGSVCNWQLPTEDLEAVSALVAAGLVATHLHPAVMTTATYTLSVAGHLLVKQARARCRECEYGGLC
jgi:hypothetical protein